MDREGMPAVRSMAWPCCALEKGTYQHQRQKERIDVAGSSCTCFETQDYGLERIMASGTAPSALRIAG